MRRVDPFAQALPHVDGAQQGFRCAVGQDANFFAVWTYGRDARQDSRFQVGERPGEVFAVACDEHRRVALAVEGEARAVPADRHF